MKQSLLQIVQSILNDMDGDEVGSISDTIESLQVAEIVRSTYHFLSSNKEWAYQKKLFELTASGDGTLPCVMYIPDNIKKVDIINYDRHPLGTNKVEFKEVKYIEPEYFIARMNKYDSEDADTITMTIDGTAVLVRRTGPPKYYTSFGEDTLIFDSYDVGTQSTLTGARTQCIGYEQNTFTLTDSFVPTMPDEAFIYLIEEAKSACSLKLRQVKDHKAEQRSQSQQRWISQNDWKVGGGIRYQNYGRCGRKGYSSSTNRSPLFPDKLSSH